MTFVCILGLWLGFASIDTSIRAPAVAVPSGETVRIKAEFNGSVRSTFKRAGEVVQLGDELLIIGDNQNNADLEQSMAKQAAMHARLSRLDAEVDQTAPIFSSRLRKFFPTTVSAELLEYQKNQREQAAKIGALKKQQLALDKELSEKRPKLRERQFSDEDILLLEQRISEIDIAINELNRQFITKAKAQQSSTLAELKLLNHALESNEYRVKQTTLSAPIDGTILKIANPQKGTISIGNTLVEIMPHSDSLYLKTVVSSSLLKYYQVGQSVTFSEPSPLSTSNSKVRTSAAAPERQIQALIRDVEHFKARKMTVKLARKLDSTNIINPVGLKLRLNIQGKNLLVAEGLSVQSNNIDDLEGLSSKLDDVNALKPALGTVLILQAPGTKQSPWRWLVDYYRSH